MAVSKAPDFINIIVHDATCDWIKNILYFGMRSKILSVFVSLFFSAFLFASQAQSADRYGACDSCGLCKNTDLSLAGSKSVYQKPTNWDSCFRCLYPTLAAGTVENCPTDQIEVKNLNGALVPTQDCRTLIVSPQNEYLNKPQQGRFYSDIGCISTGLNSFIDPNASVDFVKRLLDIVISITGAVGLIFFVKGAVQLLSSRGKPDQILAGKETLRNTLIGVLFTLFALFIFRFIAEQTLRIPGLG